MSEDTQTLVDDLASAEYEYADIDDLQEHPRNEEVYGEIDPDEAFIEDVERNGIETPLIVNEHEDCPNTVIGGHRRLEAAKQAGLNRVPVRWVSYPEPMATRRVVLNNNQRDKTEGQKTREALVLEETSREIGKNHMSKGGEGRQNFGDLRWDEDVGEQIGVSKETVRKGTDVFRFAYPDEYVHDDLRNPEKYDVSEEVREVARQQVELLDEGEQSFHGAYKAIEREQTRQEYKSRAVPEPPDGEYTVLYADPPWQYDHQKAPNRDIENHYPTMSLDALTDLDVPAADDAVCYLWATAPKLTEALAVLDAWGFDYTTCAVWDKEKIGMGYWFRGQHELLLVGTRGDISPPETDARVASVIREPRGDHSEKPDAVATLIEDAFPSAPKIELFARDARDGWDVWGDEL